MRLSEDLRWRGLIKDKTFAQDDWLDTPRTFYLGVDCSADSLQVGNLAVYILAKRLIAAGWKPVLLFGGATSLIGDPGGKDAERELKTVEEIGRNVAAIQAQAVRLFEGAEPEVVNNYDWFKDLGFISFLRDVGKHYGMSELTQRDFIAARMGEGGSGISYAEFSYSLIQGYDYWHLFREHGVELQIGGSDQWGNMLSGVPLIRKKENAEAHALSMPLIINRATGRKFGKSEEGAVWLDAARTTPTKFYQFWMNCDDEGTEDYLKVYTMLERHEIGDIIERHKQDPKQRLAQTRLAEVVTGLVHGTDQAALAARVTGYLTGREGLHSASAEDMAALKQEIPAVHAPGSVTQALTTAGLAGSMTEARRLLRDGAIALDGTRLKEDVLHDLNGAHLLRKGKRYADSALLYW